MMLCEGICIPVLCARPVNYGEQEVLYGEKPSTVVIQGLVFLALANHWGET